ncbi:bacterio-opsin activator domain-containing protein [Haloarchaeobius amylolyticus]|uniref:bacterio-opsin activator domain-containing protein n=1 Tax=Haloarchaeobius amylolyticus TaxID=1198296 RepID=UPI002271BD95|nr:bacterio-opsin activator domain-containing protein [Haloarchaeobius amylolyticus]
MALGNTNRGAGGGLDRHGYECLLRAATTPRERLVLRLGGEVGLRPFEMVAVRPMDVAPHVVDGRVRFLLRVAGGEEPRDAYLPSELERAISRYARDEGVEPAEPLFDVSVRRLQMLVSEVSSRAADQTGRESLAGVSSRDLRHYFARSLLVDREVPASVVMAVGGWSELSSLDTYVDDPTPGEVLAAFDDEAGTAGEPRVERRHDADQPTLVLDAEATITRVNQRFEARVGRTADAIVGEPLTAATTADPDTVGGVRDAMAALEPWHGTLTFCLGPDCSLRGQTTITPANPTAADPSRFVAVVTTDRPQGPVPDDRFASVQQAIREVGDAYADATTHEGVLEAVCAHLTDSDAYECAWASEAPPGSQTVPTVWAGADDGTIERLAFTGPGSDGDTLAETVVETGEVETSLRDGPDPGQAGESHPRLVVGTPLVHGDSVYGALCLVAPTASIGEYERRALATLGERVGEALTGAERKRLLLADTVVELEFACTDPDSFVVALSAELSCTIRLEGVVPVDDRALLCYVSAVGRTPETVHPVAERLVDDARLVTDHEDASLLEVTVSSETVAGTLVDHGGSVEELVAEDGQARLRAEFAPETDVRAVADAVTTAFPETELVAKREVAADATGTTGFQQSLSSSLTEKQLAVLQAAYHAGYFDWPRDSTAEELAESMGVSSPTLHNHLRRSQYKLLDAFLDGSDVGT